MTPKKNNSNDENTKNKANIIRWIVGGFFAIFALVNGFHYSSLFFICSVLLMLPLPFLNNFWKKINIKTAVVIVLSIALLFVGIFTSPLSKTSDSNNVTNDPLHEHSYINGECSCGATDPNYEPPHEHSYINGECSCGATDPNYEPPHEHSYINGECSCGATDPDGTTSGDENTEMVWVSKTGKKYHSNPSCSNMNSPRQITREEAEKEGYTPCSKC